MNKKIAVVFLLLSFLLLIFGCAKKVIQEKEQFLDSQPSVEEQQPQEISTAWMDIDLVDVRTGQTFKISDFKGKPILLESFAVWCPVCTKQQQNIKKLHNLIGDSFVSISLDTDPNEDAAKVKEAVEERGFDWYFAVSPVELTQALIDQFGVSVVDAPAAPVVLICEDLSARLLPRGIKSVDELQDELARGC